MKHSYTLLLTIYICILSYSVFAQHYSLPGTPYIQNYTSEDYNTPEDQIWSIIQDDKGLMYFANNIGVLEFDGNTWRLIEIPNKSTIRSFAFDQKTGRIYVGAVGDFGYLKTDSIGKKYFISLLDQVPEEHKSFEDVWDISILNEMVIFRTTSSIFLFQNDTIKTLLPEDRFHTSFTINNKFYVREWGKGLFILTGNRLQFIGQSGIFANKRIYAMLPYDHNKILIVTRSQSVYIYSPNSETNRFVKPSGFSDINKFLNENRPYCGVKINKNDFAVGTLQNGIIIFNKKGEIIQHLDKASGLNNGAVLSLFTDRQNNLWAGLNNGISYIISNSPFSIYNEKNGIEGTAYMTKIFNKNLYIGTSLGLYYEKQPNNFAMVENTKGQSWFLEEINGDLFLGHTDGILLIKNNSATNISSNIGTVWSLNQFKNTNYVLVGTNNGLYLLDYLNGNWTIKNKIKGFNESSRYLQIDENNTIWVTHANKGIYKLKLTPALDSVAKTDFYDTNFGLPSNTHNYVFKIKHDNQDSEIIFGTENGIFQYDHETNYFKHHPQFKVLLNHSGFIDEFSQDDKGNIYYQQELEKGVLIKQKDGTYNLERTPFLKLKGLFVEHISIIDSSRILYSCKEGVIQYNPQIKISYDEPYRVLIRQIKANDSLIFKGNGSPEKIKLPYKYNNLNFTFSALFYENPEKTEYSFMLNGFNSSGDEWSKWSLKNEKEYTNLPKGHYIFKVKARNIYEKESEITEFHFQVLPPWYNTILAYIIYGVLAFILVWFIVKYYTQRLQKEKENLEKLVKVRTKEIIKQKDDIEKINNQLIKLSIVASKTSNAVIIFSYDGTIEWFNDAFSKIYGYSFDEFINKKGNNIFEASSNIRIKDYVDQCFKTRKSIIYETYLETKDNKPVWVQTTLTPIINDDGKIDKLVAIDTDITELKKAESEIMQKNEEILSQNEEMIVQNEELEKHRHHLQELVRERTVDLEKAKERAEESDRLKSAFLANMSHEIRTPMNAIVGFTDLLNDPDLSDDEKKELITHINYNSETLLHLIDDIIDIAKIEANQVDINKKNCKIFTLVKEVYNTFNENNQNVNKNKIDFKLNIDKKFEQITLFTDPFRLQQVLSNLIQNAFKFTDEGYIEIGYELVKEKEEPTIKFYVKDTGIGMTRDEQRIIFDRFNKAEDNKKKLYRGAGLGLAISKSLIELLGGKIWVKSEKANTKEGRQGCSEFYFTLPFIVNKEKEINMTPNQNPLKSTNYNWCSKKILIAEDEDSNFRYLEMVLNKTKSIVLWAKDGIEAIEQCKMHEPDIILMDIKMPNMDGLEATREIKKIYPEIPIIAQTAFAMENDERMSLEAGCNAYLSKPVKAKKLLNTLSTFLLNE